MRYTVQIEAGDGWTRHSAWDSYRDAVDQADLVHGRIITPGGATDEHAHRYAVSVQGFVGDYAEFQCLADADRDRYEHGAAGLPTA